MRNRLLFIWLALLLGVAGANAKEAYAFYMESDHSLNFCYDDSKASIAQSYTIYDLNTGSNTPAWSNIASQIEELYFYTSFANYKPTSCYAWARDMTNLTRVRNISNLNTWSVTNMSCMFYRCSNLTSLDLSNFKTQNVTDMNSMFYRCSNLTSLNLSNFKTQNVTDMEYMFSNCSSLTSLNLSNFNTSSVTNMRYMFADCSSLTSLNLSNFNTQNVTDMSSMFSGCKKLTTLNISSFNTSKVTTFMGMFEFCSSLESLDVSKFDTSNATYELLMLGGFTGMFRGCSSLTTLDLSNFDTSKAKSMYVMFQGCSNLESVNLSSFNTSNVAYFDGMFSGCSKLTELDLSNFDFSKTSVFSLNSNSHSMLNDCSALKLLLIPSTANNLPADACYGVGTKTSPCTLVYPSGFTPDKQSSGSDWYQWKSGYFCDPVVGIPFADNTVKGICLDNWDTNGDGQLTKAEAAAVTSVGTVFKAASITTFDEFKYFTGVETISEGAFSKSTLTAITLPSSVKTIGKDAFLACKSLKSITIPAKVTTIGQNALSYCTAMTSITVASDNTAFASVSGVLFTKSRKTLLQFPAAKATTYSVPSRTTTIGRDAFFMSSLKSVELPSSLMELAYDAFGYSKSLTSVELPEGLTTIGDYAFDGCSGLKTLRLPSTVTSIGSYMCNNCKAITDIYNASTTPFSIADNNFTSTTYSNATLHVPAGRKATYAALGGWKKFTKVVDDLPGGILGDSNGDGTVSVNDVQMIVEYVLGNNPSGIILANCDVNGDNVITITDATTIVNIVLTGVQAMPPKARESLTDMVALTAKGGHCSLHLDSSEPYHAFQLEVVLPEGGSMGNVMLAQGRANGHHAEWNEVMPGRYNVIVYSFNGAALRDGSSTALLHFDIANCKADDVSVENIQMVDGWCKTVLLPSTSGIATGIAWVVDDASEGSSSPYYNTVGIGSNTPQRGVNIKDGRKVVKK